ncbi:Co-chaperone Hsc20 [Marasmius fiardii PR-910]|nr:Co-chaperone Hsc20 [Marasmius fiardii PR-910]
MLLSTRVPRRVPIPRYCAQSFSLSKPSYSKICPNCSRPLPSALPACTKCWHINPIDPETRPHAVLDIPYSPNPFEIDEGMLKRNFRQSQAACHPDAWSSKGPDKHSTAEQLSAAINNAYQTLLNPLSRIEYLLAANMHGLDETDKVEDLEFLDQIMTAREEIHSAETKEDLQAVTQENQDMINETLEDISQLVKTESWGEAKEAAIRLRYLDGIRKAVQESQGKM